MHLEPWRLERSLDLERCLEERFSFLSLLDLSRSLSLSLSRSLSLSFETDLSRRLLLLVSLSLSLSPDFLLSSLSRRESF